MPFIIHCPGCKRKLRVQEHLIGKNIKCPGCGVKLQAQAPVEANAAAPLPPAAVPNGTAVVPARAVPPPVPAVGAVGKAGQSSVPTASPPPPSSSPSNEEPLEVLDPIVLDEPPTGEPGNTAIGSVPPPLDFERTEQERAPPPGLPLRQQGSPLPVFALLMGLLLATIAVGVIGGWWINRSIESVRSSLR